MGDTIFDKIVQGTIPSYKIWEDENFLAFLTPFPNTPGFTVVIPKKNLGDYAFTLSDSQYSSFLLAVKKVSSLLEKALKVKRVVLIIEGTAIPYIHAKLIPLHGDLANQATIENNQTEFNEEYKGFLTTLEGPRMDDERLVSIQKQILSIQT